jgi:hypothetical protein
MRIRGSDKDKKAPAAESAIAAEEAARLAEEVLPFLDRAVGVEWYARAGNDVDVAAYKLCRLRRARSGERGGSVHGDEAVRAALAQASPEALVWLASRAISYMDENGFPEAVEPWVEQMSRADSS